MLIIEGKGFIVIIDLWNYWVGENFVNYFYFVVQMGFYFVINIMNLIVLLFLLVFLVFGIVDIWFSFDVIELCVFYFFMFGLDVFIGDGVGVIVNIFIEIQYYFNL